jgi:titin
MKKSHIYNILFISARKGLLLDSQHPEGWEKMKNLESRGNYSRLQVEDMPVGPPHFVTDFMGIATMCEGEIAHFEAQIEPIHDPDLRVEFFHDDKPLQQASRIHTLCDFGYVALDICQLVEVDGGEYTCKVINKYGEASSKVKLNISNRDVLDTSSQRPEGMEKIQQLESRQQRKMEEDMKTFQKPVFTMPLQNFHKEEQQAAHLAAR